MAESLADARGQSPLAIPADLTDEEAVRNLIMRVQQTHTRLDILVNNAGITFSGSLEETTTADWDRCVAVNARGAFVLCREALPLLRQGTDPCIVNISSVVGVKGYARQTAYSASKHALRGFSIALAEELQPEGIRVHVVCPGGVDTDMVQSVRPDIPREELITPEEVAEAVAFLVTRSGQGMIDEMRIRRRRSGPWF
jgi:3-oxoacyl-[acyl-carrier protein] reductase